MKKIRSTIARLSLTAGVGLMMVLGRAVPALAAPVIPQPRFDPTAPGVSGLQAIANLLVTWIVVLSFLALLASLICIPAGNALSLPELSQGGKKGVLVSILVPGAAAIAHVLVMFFYNAAGGQ